MQVSSANSELCRAGNSVTQPGELKLCTQGIKYGNTQLKAFSLDGA